jgi:hypothetical protein
MRTIALIAALIIALTAGVARADDMQSPRVTFANVDWDAVQSSLAKYGLTAEDSGEKDAANAILRLNTATFDRFDNIGSSSVPVLLPFDTSMFLADHAAGLDQAKPTDAYLFGFHTTKFFFPGPSGYDAALTVVPSEVPALADVNFSEPVEVLISGSSVLYDLGSIPETGIPVAALEPEFPGIRRLLVESRVRYTFVRYGVPYMVSVLCFDGGSREHMPSCRQADRIVVHFLQSLAVVGGMPQPRPPAKAPQTVARPAATSPDFTYYGPGQIIQGSGVRGYGGRVDYTVYARIRFPIANAPAYANSQSFMNWGDCDHTGRVSISGSGKDALYHCRVNDKPLVFDESKNYAYPWQDNFCEHRWFFVGQCPAGSGHQGQDIRPSDCHLRNEGADRCDPYQHDLVAVRDGMVLRRPKQEALVLFVNAPGEHLRFRYLHMSPKLLDEDEMVSGRVLREGEVVGKLGNYDRRENGTTAHLHFDVQVPTSEGWVFINPYSMLVASYERLIGAHGTELKQELVAAAPTEADAASGDSLATIGPAAPPAVKPDVHVASRTETRSESRSEARRNHHGGRARLGARLRDHCGHKCGGHTIRTAHNR